MKSAIPSVASRARRNFYAAPPMATLSLREFTDIMIREVDRVNQLIEQLLDLSRPAQLTLGPVNIHEILEDVLLLEAKPLAAGEIHIKKCFDPSLPPIHGDRAQLTQVFLNLVKNAFQAMDRRRRAHSDDASGNRLSYPRSRHAPQSLHLGRPRRRRVRHSRRRSSRISSRLSSRPKITAPDWAWPLAIASSKNMAALIRVESIEGRGSIFRVSLVVAD